MDDIHVRSTARTHQTQAPVEPQPVATHQSAPQLTVVEPTSNRVSSRGRGPEPRVKKFSLKKLIIAALLLLVLAGVVLYGFNFLRQSAATSIDSSKYQAVFLTSGQVYFGKLEKTNGNFMTLKNVFYLQTKTATASENPQKTATADNNVELIKLGNEIHGPEDAMIISRDQVLFYENLKTDGRVSQSIANYK